MVIMSADWLWLWWLVESVNKGLEKSSQSEYNMFKQGSGVNQSYAYTLCQGTQRLQMYKFEC